MPESPDADRIHHDALLEELEAARHKRDRYQALLKDLPELFEGKFRERIRPVQQRNEQLLEEGLALREQIRRALPQASGAGALPPAPIAAAPPSAADPSESGSETPIPASQAAFLRRWRPIRLGEGAGSGLDGAFRIPGGSSHAAFLLAGLALAGLAIGALLLRSSPPRPTTPTLPGTTPAPQATSQSSGSGSLLLTSKGPSWVEVQTAAGESLYAGVLEGQQTVPFKEGLRIRSGRADLIKIRVGDAAERNLGAVDMIEWQVISAPRSPR
jgi:hypothetical protein